jgi:hypothetical protein
MALALRSTGSVVPSTDQVVLNVPSHSLLFEFWEVFLEVSAALGCEKIGKLDFVDYVLSCISQPRELGVVDLDEDAILIEGVVTTGRMVIQVPYLVGRPMQCSFTRWRSIIIPSTLATACRKLTPSLVNVRRFV